MDKVAIKSFATEARRKMMDNVEYRASLIGITKDEIKDPISKAKGMETFDFGAGNYTIYDSDIEKRKELITEIKTKGFEKVVEEVAYTWFNRIIAIRFMEVNDYLPTRTRVLSSESPGKNEPDIITEALDLDLNYTDGDEQHIIKLQDENKLDELFQFLFVKQCNELNNILPSLFEKTDDWMELLLDINFTNEDGIIYQLINTIPEDNFYNQVEIIGWMYQFYISERKSEVIEIYKSKAINKKDIPAATQLFTPKWVVKYMVDNSLGRYWIERNGNSDLINSLDYYFIEANQPDNINSDLNNVKEETIDVVNLKFIDPCMGSGNILVYAFDVFFNIYKELGYSEKEIPELILKNNLYGLDIDDRAFQLAYFTLLMKARAIDRKIFKKDILLNVCSIKESSSITLDVINYIKDFDIDVGNKISYLVDAFDNGKEFGSLIKIKDYDFNSIELKLIQMLDESNSKLSDVFYKNIVLNDVFALIKQAKILTYKYDVVVTNPPYMNKFDKSFKDFAKKHYKDYSKDLFSMFIYRNFDFCKEYGYSALITPFSWMFLKSFEKLREFLINEKTFSSLIQLEYNAFNEIAMVPVGTFVFKNTDKNNLDYNGTYLKLSEFNGGMEVQREKVLESINNSVDYKYVSNSKRFLSIPGNPIAFWVSNELVDAFNNGTPLSNGADIKSGLTTGDNNKFLRYWFEVSRLKTKFDCENLNEASNSQFKWFPLNKGGYFRKWYGNHDFVINYENDGYDLKNFKKFSFGNSEFHFLSSISWSRVTSGRIAFRYYPNGFLFDNTGSSLFIPKWNKWYIFGFLNSNVCQAILDLIAPALHYEVGNISSIPILFNDDSIVESVVKDCIRLVKEDWDDYEYSWNFKTHPFLNFSNKLIEDSFNQWKALKINNFNSLKENEIKLNKFFSELYSVDVNYDVEDKHVSISLPNYENDVKSFISFAVGCIFGRYSLDNEGLIYAGGTFNLNNYSKFRPDNDNIVPVLDNEYFEDDIVGRFIEFVKLSFGDEYLEENLDFIANALNKKGKTSREIIRNYFLNGFFNDHIQTYKKRPIYWQFDSGRHNAFKCLIYMHRYEPDIVARIRTDYLHKTQKAIEENLAHCDSIIAKPTNNSELKKATKDKNKLIQQLDEIKEYDEALAHIAHQQIEIDLDDGVKVNYDKFQKVEIAIGGQKTKKINLLKKI